MVLGVAAKLQAADTNVYQLINLTVIGTYEEVATNVIYSKTNITSTNGFTSTNGLLPISSITNRTIRTLLINSPNVVKAIATDLNKYRSIVPSNHMVGTNMVTNQVNVTGTTNYLVGGYLYRKVNINSGQESIVIRKPHGTTNYDEDVTRFFGTNADGSFSISNNFNTTDEIATTVQAGAGFKTNLTASMNSISFTSSNLSFSITNAYNTSFLTTFGNTRVKNLMASGSGTFFVNIATPYNSTNHPDTDPFYGVTNATTNMIALTNYTLNTNFPYNTPGATNKYDTASNSVVFYGVTNVAGPAHATINTTVGVVAK